MDFESVLICAEQERLANAYRFGMATEKSDALRKLEAITRADWTAEDCDPSHWLWEDHGRLPTGKYLVTFPYPYMNGRLHLGHLMTLMKAEYAARFQLLNGKRVLFPFGFHGTGMPIAACAEKLQQNDPKQIAILKEMGIADDQIDSFKNPYHWIEYFPAKAIEDLAPLGLMINWSHSFITTDRNPYYDSFVRWQFNHLKQAGKLIYGTRASVYSTATQQPCQDHDRRTGEGIEPVKYKLVKCKLPDSRYFITYVEPKQVLRKLVFGNNCEYVQWTGESRTYVATRALLQHMLHQFETMPAPVTITATAPPGTDVTALIKYVDRCRGAIVKIVPGSNPQSSLSADEEAGADDWSKIEFVEEFYPTELIGAIYCLPEEVIARTGDACIVALLPQWYINYGEPQWRALAEECVKQMTFPNPTVRQQIEESLQWLRERPVSRQFGLGTRLPFDSRYLIDSLSDSTIYMAYYPIAPYLQGDINGDTPGYFNIRPEQLTDAVWDMIFLGSDVTADANTGVLATLGLDKFHVGQMRAKFLEWYPIDLRVSGKDLIPNHLTMAIYNHVAIFSRKHWPRSYACNGHLLINGVKMSKQEGNFLLVHQVTPKYPADVIRLTLADTSDGLDDGNFVVKNAEQVYIMKLHTLVQTYTLLQEKLDAKNLRTASDELNIFDRHFIARSNQLAVKTYRAYENMQYRLVIAHGLNELSNCLDKYRVYCNKLNIRMHQHAIECMLLQLVLLYPIIPHTTHYLWTHIMKQVRPLPEADLHEWIQFAENEYADAVKLGVIVQFDSTQEIISDVLQRYGKYKRKHLSKGDPFVYNLEIAMLAGSDVWLLHTLLTYEFANHQWISLEEFRASLQQLQQAPVQIQIASPRDPKRDLLINFIPKPPKIELVTTD